LAEKDAHIFGVFYFFSTNMAAKITENSE